MPYLVGIGLALAVSLMARATGFDRDRAFYPTVLLVIASYYVLFAAMGGTAQTVLAETLMLGIFFAAAVTGFRSNLWFVVAALAAHGLLDVMHQRVVVNPGVPGWWPAFCLSYDLTAAAYLTWLLTRSPGVPHARPSTV